MSKILEEARLLLRREHEQQERRIRDERLARERAYKDAIFEALGVLGCPSPSLNYMDKLRRVPNVTWACFEVEYDGLIIRNESGHYRNLFVLEDPSSGRRVTLNICDGETPEAVRVNWIKRIAAELVLGMETVNDQA